MRLLNAAMVNGYSIVTYQRSLRSADACDLPISVNESIAIVWGLGPLNQRNEVSYHTHFNKKTMSINFGRQPTWNCPMPEGSTGKTASTDSESVEQDISESDVENENRRDTKISGYPPAGKPHSSETEEEFYEDRLQAQALSQRNRRPQTTNRPFPTPKPAPTTGAWEIPAIQCYEPEGECLICVFH